MLRNLSVAKPLTATRAGAGGVGRGGVGAGAGQQGKGGRPGQGSRAGQGRASHCAFKHLGGDQRSKPTKELTPCLVDLKLANADVA